MAIGFSQAASVTQLLGFTALATPITVNTGDTVVVFVVLMGTGATATATDDATPPNVYTLRGSSIATSGGVTLYVLSTTAQGAAAAANVTGTSGGSGQTVNGLCVLTYSNVSALGTTATPTTGSSTAPSISLSTQDANNFVVAGMVADLHSGAARTWSASVGNLRTSVATSTTVPGIAGMDNTAASATSVTDTATLSATDTWACVALELRLIPPTARPLSMLGHT